MKKLFILLLLSLCAFSQTHTFPATDTNNTWTGINTFNGTPTTFSDVVVTGTCTGCAVGGSGYATIQSAAVAITQRTIVNFFGALSCVDNPGSTRSDCKLIQNAAVTNQYLTGIDASGNFLRKQIDYGELSGVPSTFAPAGHTILSTAHTDTTAAALVRGDGLFAIGATPTLQRLAHPSVTGGYFKWNGTDVVASSLAASGTGAPTACTNQAVTSLTLNADAAPTSTCSTITSSFLPAATVWLYLILRYGRREQAAPDSSRWNWQIREQRESLRSEIRSSCPA